MYHAGPFFVQRKPFVRGMVQKKVNARDDNRKTPFVVSYGLITARNNKRREHPNMNDKQS